MKKALLFPLKAAFALLPYKIQQKICVKIRNLPQRARILFYKDIILGNRFIKKMEIESPDVFLRLPAKTRLNLKDYSQATLFYEPLPAFLPSLIAFCDENTGFYDIGSNIGMVSLAMSRLIPSRNICAFEPVPSTFARLAENMKLNDSEANLYQIAISSKSAELEINSPKIDSGSSTLENKEDISNIHNIHTVINKIWVKSLTFEDWERENPASHPKVAFKIDVEGHELHTLAGMEKFLRKYTGKILMILEVQKQNGEKAHEFLVKAGLFPIISAQGILTHHQDCIYAKL